MMKELPFPSKISLVLNISYKEVEQVMYFVNYIVLKPGHGKYAEYFHEKDVIDLSNTKAVKSSRGALRRLIRAIQDDTERGTADYQRARVYYERLKNSALPFSFDEVARFITRHTGLELGIGAEAIYTLLQRTDLDHEYESIQARLRAVTNFEDDNVRKMLKRLEVIT
ncbi:unnamed protein product [Didymodactylos carnosus]|uniref:Uncharacterized protein n=1 Tax=Didymodactylos carnosus TaxID=1234261 RepID=A0A8S2CQU9_9BILA|nr:unnamed protein product [Didymodactylos carnosus]CAF3492175.1 unnamed protein product [Didymodactylos carnosus]